MGMISRSRCNGQEEGHIVILTLVGIWKRRIWTDQLRTKSLCLKLFYCLVYLVQKVPTIFVFGT